MPKQKRVPAGDNLFVKTLRKSSPTCLVRFSSPNSIVCTSEDCACDSEPSDVCTQTIPAAFVRAHAEHFGDPVKMGFDGRIPQAVIHVTATFLNGYAHVAFRGGWKAFAEAHGLKHSNRVKFELVRWGCFNVSKLGTSAAGSASLERLG